MPRFSLFATRPEAIFTRSPLLLTGLALVAFAANSLLCRMALLTSADQPASIDPASFTFLRLTSGAITLVALVVWRQPHWRIALREAMNRPQAWGSAFSLWVYALCFSLAYVQLDTGIGALILFGAVQITMVLLSVLNGQRLTWREIFGLLLAFSGLLILTWPSLATPSLTGLLLMLLAGVAWGLYSWLGTASQNGLQDTMHSFVLCLLPLLCATALWWWFAAGSDSHQIKSYQLDLTFWAWLTAPGAVYALLSGVVASGLGYAIWYQALQSLTGIQAAVSMLLVPILAALAGVLVLDELLEPRFYLATLAVLGGVLLVIMGKRKH